MKLPHMSLGTRLTLLVLSELLTAAVVVVTAIYALVRLGEHNRYIHSYVFQPLVDVGAAFNAEHDLSLVLAQPSPPLATVRRDLSRLESFIERYASTWEVGTSSSPEAVRFRGILERSRQAALLDDEHEAVRAAQDSLRALERALDAADQRGAALVHRHDLSALDAALVQLDAVNLKYMEAAHDAYMSAFKEITLLVMTAGAFGLLAAPLLGLSARRAIAPRVAQLVEKIRLFRDFGVHEPIGEVGGDELAMLARALDVSFVAIAARSDERARFLAIAAHELKTPLTTLKGYAQIARAHRDNAALRDRALDVIDRQATRLNRLVEDLLSLAKAQSGQLSFHPVPLDLADLTRGAIAEIEIVGGARRFPFTARGDAIILGDADLLEQSVATLLTQATSMTPPSAPVEVAVEGQDGAVNFRIAAQGTDMPASDLHKLLEPFAIVQYEGQQPAGLRSTGVGLHIVRETARLHGAHFHIERRAEDIIVFSLEFRR